MKLKRNRRYLAAVVDLPQQRWLAYQGQCVERQLKVAAFRCKDAPHLIGCKGARGHLQSLQLMDARDMAMDRRQQKLKSARWAA